MEPCYTSNEFRQPSRGKNWKRKWGTEGLWTRVLFVDGMVATAERQKRRFSRQLYSYSKVSPALRSLILSRSFLILEFLIGDFFSLPLEPVGNQSSTDIPIQIYSTIFNWLMVLQDKTTTLFEFNQVNKHIIRQPWISSTKFMFRFYLWRRKRLIILILMIMLLAYQVVALPRQFPENPYQHHQLENPYNPTEWKRFKPLKKW